MSLVYFITHPDVTIDPALPATQWPLSHRGKERMKKLLTQSWVQKVTSVYSSTEQKSIDGAIILADHLAIKQTIIKELGEVDRSATGYLPYDLFMAVYNEFLTYPSESIRGWESAYVAQQRIIKAIEFLIANDKGRGDIVLVSHGAVGLLYLCHLKGCKISMQEEQPSSNGGNYYCFDRESNALLQGWKPIDG